MRTQQRPLPSWRRRQIRQIDEDQRQRHERRVGAIVGVTLIAAIWSNRTYRAYCVGCEAHAPQPAVSLAMDPSTVCAHCARPLREAL